MKFKQKIIARVVMIGILFSFIGFDVVQAYTTTRTTIFKETIESQVEGDYELSRGQDLYPLGYANMIFNEPIENYYNDPAHHFSPGSNTGAPPIMTIEKNGYRGFNYMRLQSRGSNDGFAKINVSPLVSNTFFFPERCYKLTAYVRIPTFESNYYPRYILRQVIL